MSAVVTAAVAVLLAIAPSRGTKSRNPPMSYEGYAEAWNIAMHAAKYDAAEKIAREGCGKYPGKFAFHYMIGASLTAQNRDAAAFYEYEWELLRVGPDRPSGKASSESATAAMKSRGTEGDEVRTVVAALEGETLDPEKSVSTLQNLLDHRDAFILRLLLAEGLVKAQRPAEAISLYRGLLKQDPFFVPAYKELSDLLKRSKKTAHEGETLLAKAQSIDPDHFLLKGL